MSKKFEGFGGDRPVYGDNNSGGGGGGSKFRVKGHRLYEAVNGGKDQKKISFLKLDYGEKHRPVTVLDPEVKFASRLHKKFFHDGTFENYVTCRSALGDPRGCPLCAPLLRRKVQSWIKENPNKEMAKCPKQSWVWYAFMTAISHHEFIPDEGNNKGKVYTDFRCMAMISSSSYEDFESEEEVRGGLRLGRFLVSRGTKPMAAGIGGKWIYKERITENDLIDTVSEAAARYKLPAEQYIEPYDYKTILSPMTYDKMLELAQSIADADGYDLEDLNPDDVMNLKSGGTGVGSSSTKRPARQLADAGTGDDSEEDIPF